MSSTLEVGKKLVELLSQHKALEAVDTLYGADIVCIEPQAGPDGKREMHGIAAIRGKNEWWVNNHNIHEMLVNGPWPHDDRFIVHFKLDVTATGGPMKGKRFGMEETGLYTVKHGKIVKEEYFYHMQM